MRHGKSLANQLGLIVSSPDNGVKSYGLTTDGQGQVINSVANSPNVSDISLILSSDFQRARETAEITHEVIGCKEEVVFHKHLRERSFGDLELSNDTYYQKVWDQDALDGSHTTFGVESTEAVMERATSLVMTLDGYFTDTTFLLVSHGDTLQILQTAFAKLDAGKHRSLPHLETAEIRELLLDTEVTV